MLPGPQAEYKSLVSAGLLMALCGGCGLLLVGWLGLMRISRSKASVALRQRSLIKLVLLLMPGLLASVAVAFMITREPGLNIDIVNPTRADLMVAPVSVTLSAQRAADVLRKLGIRPLKYQWDTDGDGKPNEETVVPTTTVLFSRQGVYPVILRINLEGGGFRRLTRRVVIPQAVFSATPESPIVEKPVRFSVADLLTDVKQLENVVWDYGDGSDVETTTAPETAHTYYATGEYEMSVILTLINKTQYTLKRTLQVSEPPPLPFPVTLTTEPKNLIGGSPFGALFRIDTEEQLQDIHWQFGDGKEERGADLKRIGHTFQSPGIYPVITRIRNLSGALAEITTIVRVSETLALSDLRFEGEPEVVSNKIKGEVPLTISLTPKTGVPLVRFFWETSDPANVKTTGETVEGVFRREGTYTLTLVGQDADGKVMRMSIPVTVEPPSAEPTILVQPDGGVAPLRVVFDASQSYIPENETIAGFKWLFGDEGQGASAVELGAARVEHLYKTPGDFTVTLKVVLASGKEFVATRTIVVRKPSLSSCIVTSRLRVQVGRGVEFDSSCTAGTPTSYLWDVRYDPQPDTSIAQSPSPKYVHVFSTPGTYTVTLTVKDAYGNQSAKDVSITVTDTPSGDSSSS